MSRTNSAAAAAACGVDKGAMRARTRTARVNQASVGKRPV
jgi:hypothetical protein